MFFFVFLNCVLSCVGRRLCDGLVTRLKEFDRVSKQSEKPPVCEATKVFLKDCRATEKCCINDRSSSYINLSFKFRFMYEFINNGSALLGQGLLVSYSWELRSCWAGFEDDTNFCLAIRPFRALNC
jgi:hypothetical protein